MLEPVTERGGCHYQARRGEVGHPVNEGLSRVLNAVSGLRPRSS